MFTKIDVSFRLVANEFRRINRLKEKLHSPRKALFTRTGLYRESFELSLTHIRAPYHPRSFLSSARNKQRASFAGISSLSSAFLKIQISTTVRVQNFLVIRRRRYNIIILRKYTKSRIFLLQLLARTA